MDIYALNSSRLREHIVDRFESFIWTERYSEIGEFEIVVHSSALHRTIFSEGRWLVQNGSFRVMVVDTLEDTEDSEGRSMLKVTGRSLEAILEERIVALDKTQLQNNTRWLMNGFTPADLMRHIFEMQCIVGRLDERDAIPGVVMTNMMPPQTIPEPAQVISRDQEIVTMYAFLRDMATIYSLGFALLLNPDTGSLHFQVFTGSNRTSAQYDLAPVVFSPDLDNLSNTSELISTANHKNVAIVVSDYGMIEVYAEGASPGTRGFERKVLLVKASGIKEEDADKEGLMRKQGQDELAKHKRIMAFDGEIPQNGYKYGLHYFLGDITEMRKNTGATNYMRVSEQIFVDDLEGERSYPTLSLDSYIAPHSWYAYPPNINWDEVDPDTVWYDLPE